LARNDYFFFAFLEGTLAEVKKEDGGGFFLVEVAAAEEEEKKEEGAALGLAAFVLVDDANTLLFFLAPPPPPPPPKASKSVFWARCGCVAALPLSLASAPEGKKAGGNWKMAVTARWSEYLEKGREG
jgi:hypothetical protein